MRNKIVVVTGASAGLGRATALAFAKRGAHVALLARSVERLESARAEIERHGVRALPIAVDVSDDRAVAAAADRIEQELGPIDVWVNNAMVSVFSPISQMTADEYRRVTDVTYLGYVWGTLAALRHMKARGRGVIVQVGSALGHRSIPLQSAYCAAKHAIVGFTESLRTELLHDESPISVVMVEMPALNTPQFDWSRSKMPRRAKPVPPIYQPEVGADAIVFAAEHPERRSVWLGVSTAEAIVGNRIAPGLLDRFLAKTAFESQQTDERERHRGDNLFVPPRGDPGAHGRFDRKARTRAPELALAKHRGAALAVMAGMALVVGTLVVIRGVGS